MPWSETQHPRGQPENAGEFAPKGGGGSGSSGSGSSSSGSAPTNTGKKGWTPNYYLKLDLKAKGFEQVKKQQAVNGLPTFVHSSGVKVVFHEPSGAGKQTSSSTWTTLKPGQSPITGTGNKLSETLQNIMQVATEVTTQIKQEAKAAATPASWTKIGGQKGSNPGGLYKDAAGKQHYVKFYSNPQQARTEVVSSAVFQAMGVGTVNPTITEVEGKQALATDYNPNLLPVTFNNLAQDRKDQLACAYVAAVLTKNWDVVGQSSDNLLIDAQTGSLVEVDHGGSFKFRAQGAAKPYGGDIDEAGSLLSSTKNPQTYNAFKNLNADSYAYALNKLQSLNTPALEPYFKKLDGGDEMYQSFHSRALKMEQFLQNQIMAANVASQAAKPEKTWLTSNPYATTPTTPMAPPSYKEDLDDPDSTAPPPTAPMPASVMASEVMKANLKKAIPTATSAEKNAVKSYSGSHYGFINKQLRQDPNFDPNSDESCRQIDSFLGKASTPEDIIVYRAVNGEYAKMLASIMATGCSFVDRGYMSTSLKREKAQNFGNGFVMKINAPKGSKGVYIKGMSQHPHEDEVLFARNCKIVVQKYDRKAHYAEVTIEGVITGDKAYLVLDAIRSLLPKRKAAMHPLDTVEDAIRVRTNDPLTSKGEEIMSAMKKQYGEKKGESVFYASKNKGTISGVDADPTYVRAKQNQYVGRAAAASGNNKRKVDQLKWEMKNSPGTLSKEDKDFLRQNGVKVNDSGEEIMGNVLDKAADALDRRSQDAKKPDSVSGLDKAADALTKKSRDAKESKGDSALDKAADALRA